MNTTNPLVQAFAFDSHAVRVVMKEGEPWFVAKDVVSCLELEWKTGRAGSTSPLDDDEKDVQIIDTLGGKQEMSVINESGLYTLILRCRSAVKPGTPAHTFRKWVTAEVLPALRKTGRYAAPGAAQGADARMEQLLTRVDRLCDIVEKLIEALPALVAAAQPKPRRPRKRLFEPDIASILALSAQGAKIEDIARLTGFSQTQVWCVNVGRYTIAPGGRVLIDARSPAAHALKGAA